MNVIKKINVNNVSYDIETSSDIEVRNDDSTAELNIGDENGNIIAQFKGGHIRTKKFDSQNITLSDEINSDFYKNCKNYGKKVAVFGGSLSVNPESETAKNMWRNLLKMDVKTYGIGGAGFSSEQGASIQQQVRTCGASGITYDIFILWASTNDYRNSREVGVYTDYSEDDNYDESKLVTQCGGINYAIKYLMNLNPKAEIYFFTGMRFFSSKDGYDPYSTVVNQRGVNFAAYVEAQKKCCERRGIPILDQFNFHGCNEFNYTQYYKEDKLHLTNDGYAKIGPVQVDFLANGY